MCDLQRAAHVCAQVHRIIAMARKHQAFVEFTTLEESERMLTCSVNEPIRVGTRYLIAQYSNKPEISTPPRDVVGRLIALPDPSVVLPFCTHMTSAPCISGPDGSPSKVGFSGEGGKVLLVTITNLVYPVNVETLHKVFAMEVIWCGQGWGVLPACARAECCSSAQGKVDKIVNFVKQGKAQVGSTHARTHASTHARTLARSLARSPSTPLSLLSFSPRSDTRTHACTHAMCSYLPFLCVTSSGTALCVCFQALIQYQTAVEAARLVVGSNVGEGSLVGSWLLGDVLVWSLVGS